MSKAPCGGVKHPGKPAAPARAALPRRARQGVLPSAGKRLRLSLPARVACHGLAVLLAAFPAGCALRPPAVPTSALRDRILPPIEAPDPAAVPATEAVVPSLPVCNVAADGAPCDDPLGDRPLTLAEAMLWADANNPRLRVAWEAIEQARGGRQVAFAPFLPHLSGDYRYVASASETQGFAGTNIPFVIGFGPGTQEFQLAELHLQWTVYDFGRTQGRVGQADTRIDIAQLQWARARQTVGYDVAAAYFRVLLARANEVVEQQAVRRAESVLEITRNLHAAGVVDRDPLLRAEVQLAAMRQGLVAAQSARLVAVASLNLAMGRNVSASTRVVEQVEEPAFALSLADCLHLAVANRREFLVAQRSVALARQGVQVARSDFLPRVFVRGTVANVDGAGIVNENVQVGGIHLDMNFYEGGRRLGELRVAESSARAALAQAQIICDTIASRSTRPSAPSTTPGSASRLRARRWRRPRRTCAWWSTSTEPAMPRRPTWSMPRRPSRARSRATTRRCMIIS